MPGETNLGRLLASMQPVIHNTAYVFCSLAPDRAANLPFAPIGSFREAEGTTIIIEQPDADAHAIPYDECWACITLQVHSSLAAVGFLAAIGTRLSQAGISMNPVSGFYHDHLFVPWERREDALAVLASFQGKI